MEAAMISNLVIVLYILALVIGIVPTYFFLKDWKNDPKSDPIVYSIFPCVVVLGPFLLFLGTLGPILVNGFAAAFGSTFQFEVIDVRYYFGCIVLSEAVVWIYMVVHDIPCASRASGS
jgi:hypothetical protein